MADDKIIEFDKVVAGYTPSLTILNRRRLKATQRRDHAADRAQRRRQVDGAEDAVRHARCRARAKCASTARASTASRQRELLRRRHRVRAAGPQPVRLAVGAAQPRARRHHAAARELPGRIEEVLQRFPRIRERIDNQASTMSGGEQKQLEVGRALLLRPRVLLIDEPSIGLSPKLVQDVMTLLRQLADQRHDGADGRAERAHRAQDGRRARWCSRWAGWRWTGRASELLDDPEPQAAVPRRRAPGRTPAVTTP